MPSMMSRQQFVLYTLRENIMERERSAGHPRLAPRPAPATLRGPRPHGRPVDGGTAAVAPRSSQARIAGADARRALRRARIASAGCERGEEASAASSDAFNVRGRPSTRETPPPHPPRDCPSLPPPLPHPARRPARPSARGHRPSLPRGSPVERRDLFGARRRGSGEGGSKGARERGEGGRRVREGGRAASPARAPALDPPAVSLQRVESHGALLGAGGEERRGTRREAGPARHSHA